jgi:hypothetical protein
MPTFIEYDLGDGQTLLVQALETDAGNVVMAARDGGNVIIKARKSFNDALKEAKTQAKLLIEQIEDLPVNEAEIKFGLTTTGELGNLAIGKIALGVNYEVTLKWKKATSTK